MELYVDSGEPSDYILSENENHYHIVAMGNDHLLQWMEEHGIRPTSGREVILSVLAENRDAHPTAEEIYTIARHEEPSMGMATVYRTLELFIEYHLVRKCDFGDGKARFELKTGVYSPVEHHHHLICKQCGKIVNYTNFREEEKRFLSVVEQGLSDKYAFEIEGHTIRFYGCCADCRQQE